MSVRGVGPSSRAARADTGPWKLPRRTDTSHHVKRVVLPSGKTIEVVYFERRRRRRAGEPVPRLGAGRDLHVCPDCDSELVYPATWEEAGPENWYVTLRCPECESCREGVFTQDTSSASTRSSTRGTEALTARLQRLMRANMAEEMDRFAAALQADAILPEDF